MEAKSKEFEKISRIAHGKIPVSEDSPVFELFSARRILVERLCRDMLTEADRQHLVNYLEDIEDRIKEYLYL